MAHPMEVREYQGRRVKNDEADATSLADLLRMGSLPEGWIDLPPSCGSRAIHLPEIRRCGGMIGLSTSLRITTGLQRGSVVSNPAAASESSRE